MNTDVLRWISVTMLVVCLALWVLWYLKTPDRSRIRKLFGFVLLGFFLELAASFVGNTAIGMVLLVAATLSSAVAFVLMVREARATWRGQMEKVKHL